MVLGGPIDQRRISIFRQYVLAVAHGFNEIADAKEEVVIQHYDIFCRTDLKELFRRCSITNVEAAPTVERLAQRWKAIQAPSRPQPPARFDDLTVFMHGWRPLAGGKTVTSPITAVAMNTGLGATVDVFLRDTSTLCHIRWKDGAWGQWRTSREVKTLSQQSVVQYSQSSLSIYALETDGECWESYFDLSNGVWLGGTNSLGQCLNGTVISAPSATCNFTHSPSASRTDLCAIDIK